jgi:hypothetical protein
MYIATMKSISGDKKSVLVNVVHSRNAVIGGATLALAGAGIVVYATVMGE